jgi:hypothetical protein
MSIDHTTLETLSDRRDLIRTGKRKKRLKNKDF